MMAAVQESAVMSDLLVAVQLVARKSATKLLRAWLYVPAGIFAILATAFGANKLLQLGAVSFPASVACLIILLLGLLLLERMIGENRTKRVVAIIEIPGGWLLQWINVFFTPSFILLPLSPSIGGIEVLKIIAVFVIGFVVMMALAAYMTRGLQLAFGSSKRAMTERAEELGAESDGVLMTATPRSANTTTAITGSEVTVSTDAMPELQSPPRSRGSLPSHHASREPSPDTEGRPTNLPPQIPAPPPRATRWASAISSRLDMIIYALLFTFIGLPTYYATAYALPLQLPFTVLTYFAALSLPPAWRHYLHPVLVSSLLTVLGLWVLGLTKGYSLAHTLAEFRTGATYLALWSPSSKSQQRPGAGDVFASALDAAIVALALPMYRYRRELRLHFPAVVLPNVALSLASLFAYPPLCRAVGISATRGLAFAARSLTLALALPAVANLGGDGNAVAALAIASGIVGVLVGGRMLRLLRIPEDDYVTRGVTLGANSSAIATALLLRTDPRAAALSSLSMSIFGAVTVLFTSIPPIVTVIRSLVSL
ncbi:LrgB-like family-domain-containing protein [Nemania diffusa]|nr:LrgB-like family-domain-containing protein [Nemania diffusa]